MQISQDCLVIEHKNQPITHLCVYKECLNDSRWTCGVCLQNKFHHHMRQNNNHLMDKEQIIQLLSQQQTSFEQLISQIQKDIFSLTRQQINRIINVYQSYDNNQQMQQIDKSKQINSNQNNSDFKYTLFFEHQFKFKCLAFDQTWISPNEKFLLFIIHRICYVFDLRSKQKVYQRRIKDDIQTGFFSKDSKYFLMCNNFDNRLNCYRVNQNFKLVNQFFTKASEYQNQIIFINPHIFLQKNTSDKIMLKNMKIKLILNPRFFKFSVQAFDYCYQQKALIFVEKQQEDSQIKLIIVPSFQVIIQQKLIYNNHTHQINIVKNNQFVTAQGEYGYPNRVYLWEINYDLKEITIKKVFQSEFPFRAIHYFIKIDRIYIYYEKSIQIINLDFQTIQIIMPKLEKESNNLSILTYQNTE